MRKGEDFTGVTIVYFCHDGNGKLLLSKRSTNCRDEHGCWEPGGGALEFGEAVTDTLRREIREEYCTDVLEYEFLGYRDAHRTHNGKPTHWIALDFKVLVDASKVQNGEPHKFDAIEWFDTKQLPEPLHSQFGICWERYKDRF